VSGFRHAGSITYSLFRICFFDGWQHAAAEVISSAVLKQHIDSAAGVTTPVTALSTTLTGQQGVARRPSLASG